MFKKASGKPVRKHISVALPLNMRTLPLCWVYKHKYNALQQGQRFLNQTGSTTRLCMNVHQGHSPTQAACRKP